MKDNLSEKIYTTLRDDIETGVLKPATIITEAQIALQFGVSKAPVKTALKKLCDNFYLDAYPRKGYVVSVISKEDFEELQTVRAHYEKLSIILAIQNASDAEIESLRRVRDGENFDQSGNYLFHTRLAEIGHNGYHAEMIERLMCFQCVSVSMDEEAEARHEAIIQALLERNCDLAIQKLEEDLDV